MKRKQNIHEIAVSIKECKYRKSNWTCIHFSIEFYTLILKSIFDYCVKWNSKLIYNYINRSTIEGEYFVRISWIKFNFPWFSFHLMKKMFVEMFKIILYVPEKRVNELQIRLNFHLKPHVYRKSTLNSNKASTMTMQYLVQFQIDIRNNKSIN